MTPPMRMKCDSQEPDNSDERTTNPPAKRCDRLYFNDGNIVLIAENTAFRVHKGLLAVHSDVFRDMFNDVNQSDRAAEVFDGCSVVRLSDDDEALETFLKALYMIEPIPYPEEPASYFLDVLRLATKYLCNTIRRQALDAFRCRYYPDTLPAWDARDSSLAPEYTIRLARDIKAEILLPAAFYHLCQSAFPEEELYPNDIVTYYVGKAKLGALWLKFLENQMVHCKEPPCTHPHCREDWTIFLEKKILEALKEFQGPWADPLSQFNKFSQDIDEMERVCLETKKIIRKLCDEKRVEIWNKLPEIFKLESWEKLRAADDNESSESSAAPSGDEE